MEDNLEEICIWKIVADNDREKMRKGDSCVTLKPDKPCFKCEGTREYAIKIKCPYYELGEIE